MLVASDFFDRHWWREWMRGDEGIDFAPKAGINEDDHQFALNIDLPGFKKDDLQVEVRKNQLVIKGERRQESHDNDYGREERSFGAFERRFALPETVDSGAITVGYRAGVLQVVLPKHEEVAPRRLEIDG